MTESLRGQRTADELTLRVAATVDTVDEALTWIVRQLDVQGIRQPQFGASPVWGYGDGEEPQTYFEVWITGTPHSREPGDA